MNQLPAALSKAVAQVAEFTHEYPKFKVESIKEQSG
jgi:hypothetical protein